MKLLLTSEGIQDAIKPTFFNILPKPINKISLTFVTTAAYGLDSNTDWLNVRKEYLINLGLKNIEDLDLRDKTERDIEKVLNKKDIIYVNGGNTFYLLKYIKESGFDKVIHNLHNSEKIYIGVSAGSYVACPTIEQALWKQQFNNRKTFGITDLSALYLVPFILIAHYEEKFRNVFEQASKKCQYPVVVLNNNQAILVENNRYKLVGDSTKIFFNNFKEN
jgi:dipeptidase E